jgi:hypothetical protein
MRLGEASVHYHDAGSDPRFLRQASVHAMQLKSVLCAPIRGQSSVRGALYLDNRLARARFRTVVGACVGIQQDHRTARDRLSCQGA